MFENREAIAFYVKVTEAMTDEQRVSFGAKVQKFFDEKTVSEEGKYNCFKVTKDDLMQLATVVAVGK